jgi:DNA repair exonuclease SbcCD ATPase subunit
MMACLAAFVLTGCNDGKNNAANNAAQSDSLNSIIAQKDSELNDMLGTLNEIEDGLNQINEAENRVVLLKNGEGATKRQKLKEDVQFIATRMKQNKELLAKLQKQLANSSFQGDQLKKTIENLQKQLVEKEKQLQALREELDSKDIHIAALDETINNLNTKTSNLTKESSKKTEVINAQDKQLNTAWYVFGTKKELKNQHIMENGKVMTGNFNKSYFTKVDIREVSEIKLYSKSAKLLTTHPSSSYTLVRDANKQYTLRITNSQIFWSTSKYLVVFVK